MPRTTIQTKEKMLNVIRTSCFDQEVDVPVVAQQQTLVNQKVQRKIEVPQALEQIVEPIMDGMVPQISQTEVMKKIVQTVSHGVQKRRERRRWRRTESLRVMTGALTIGWR